MGLLQLFVLKVLKAVGTIGTRLFGDGNAPIESKPRPYCVVLVVSGHWEEVCSRTDLQRANAKRDHRAFAS